MKSEKLIVSTQENVIALVCIAPFVDFYVSSLGSSLTRRRAVLPQRLTAKPSHSEDTPRQREQKCT